VVADWGAIGSAPLVLIGSALGLYDTLAEGGPQTSAELAQRTGTAERSVREWLLNQAAGGVVSYDATSQRFALPLEQALEGRR
jgi:DNA-binding IclR family transcriptional regulator